MDKAAHPFHIVIPARYGSSRLPGKPLRELLGRPMIEHVYQRALEAGAATVVVATDDPRIKEVVDGFGGTCMMTAATHESGTDRLAEVAEQMRWRDDEVIVNLQGDEPTMPAHLLIEVSEALWRDERAGLATVAVPISRSSDVFDPNVVKVVLDREGMAMYFSRAPIPFDREHFSLQGGERGPLRHPGQHLRHLGLYAYRAATLRAIANTAPTAYETMERLEQLRPMTLGIRILVSVIDEAPGHGVDTEQDLVRVEAELAAGPDAPK